MEAVMSVSASDIRESEPNPNAAPPVFISHSYVDAAWKERIAGSLASRSVAVWAASYTRTTNSWDEETQHAIDNAPVVVLLISPHYFNSQAIQGREIPYLLAQKKRLFAVLVDYCEWQKVDWLTGIQMFPSNGRPLSAVDSIEMESYLASAAIEISSLAGIANTVQTASAKVSDLDGRFVGMATLVNADVAIAVFPSDMKEATFNLEFSGIGFTSVARRLLDDSNLTLLSLSSPAYWEIPVSTIVPPSGTVWECMSFPSASDAGVVTTGTILGVVTRNGREYLHLKLSIVVNESRGMAGAAIVVEGRVVAILESQGAILDEWFAVPLQSIASSTIWAEAFSGNLSTSSEGASLRPTPEVPSSTNIPTSSATATPAPTPVDSELEFDRSGFVTRLTPDAVAALLRADGYRLALRQKRLHMEHLLLGLYGQADSPIRRLARDAKIYDERSFQRFFSKANPGLKGDVSPRPPVPPLVLPELSAHVREALITAQKIGGQRIGRVSLLNGALSVNCGALSGLRSLEPPPRAEESIGLRDWIIGVSSDVPGGRDEDLLNLKRDVNALCSVIAAADAHLPLSIGLFGEWGSGKSFFMNMMEQRLVDLQKVGPPTFCSRIVQLKFNAWHYMDTSLWASLTSEIFEGLATTLSTSTGPEPTNKAAELLVDVSTSRDRLADAERQSESAKIKLAESEARLRALASGEAEIRASLSPRLLFTEAAHLAFEQKEVKDEFDKAARELNLSQAVGAGADVNKELLELRGIFNAMFVAMRNTERLCALLFSRSVGLRQDRNYDRSDFPGRHSRSSRSLLCSCETCSEVFAGRSNEE
jgi:TIR domain/KAP family P-loop domain